MNSNVVFRSHLMQQFVSAASSQVRPPIALAGASLSRKESSKNTKSSRRSSSVSARTDAGNRVDSNVSFFRKNVDAEIIFPSSSLHHNVKSNVRENISSNLAESYTDKQKSDKDSVHRNLNLPDNFSLIETVLDRAINACLLSYSQQKHCIEYPFVLRRFITRSQIIKFSDIAYEVTMKNQLIRGAPDAMAIAERKKKKWSEVTACMVALVGNQPKTCAKSTLNPYSEIQYTPPATERQLQAYGQSYAAVQVLLESLKQNNVLTKWITGPVTRTHAFREHVGAGTNDRVIGLVLVG